MRRGVRLAVDVGSVRIGVARSDIEGRLAVPVETVRRGTADVARIAQLAAEWSAIEVVVGLPRGLSGDEGAAAQAVRGFATELADVVPLPLRLVDERFTTVSAQRGLHAAGRDVRASRAVVDQAAATVLLQDALDRERNSGEPPGELLTTGELA
jgi:putative Holliday junction resolvase